MLCKVSNMTYLCIFNAKVVMLVVCKAYIQAEIVKFCELI